MSRAFQFLVFVALAAQVYGYKTCRYYSNSHHHDYTLIRCSSSEYCCDRGCCRKVYSIWYFWTLLLFGIFIALIFCWWYKAHRRRQQTRVIQRSTIIPMQVVQPYPPPQAVNYPNQPLPQYPSYAFAPPPYAIAVNQPPPNAAPPSYAAQMPVQAGQQPKP